MDVHISPVGVAPINKKIIWPENWPIPREGDTVETMEYGPLYVLTVVWYPEGDYDMADPFVYVVIGNKRN